MPTSSIIAMDLEGCLVPEIWLGVAERTGIDALRRTTRDEPDYDVLMQQRLAILREHDIGIDLIQEVIDGLGPLPGARAFVDWVRERTQLIILSDTFYQFATPLMRQLGWPTLFCHRLSIADDGMIADYHLRMPDQKRHCIEAFRALRFATLAIGDSYNDTSMLIAADRGLLFHAPDNVRAEFPQFPANERYEQLQEHITAFLADG